MAAQSEVIVSGENVFDNGVSLEDVSSIIEEEQQPPEEKKEESESTDNSKEEDSPKEEPSGDEEEETEEVEEPDSEVPEVKKITIDDDEYDEAEIVEALSDRANKKKWQATQTQRDQELAEMRKTIEPHLALTKMLNEKPEVVGILRETLVEELGEDAGKVIDGILKFDPEKFPNPHKTDLEKAKEENSILSGEIALRDEMDKFQESHNCARSKVQKVLDFAVKKHEETGQSYSLEDAYKMMNHDKLEKKLNEKPKPKVPPKVPDKSGGAVEFKEDKRVKRFEDISIEGLKLVE